MKGDDMPLKTWIAAGLLALFANAALAEKPPESWDGLVEVKSKKFDAAYLAPGADFRPYTRIMVDPTQVAFRKNWMKNINDDRRGVSGKVTEEDAKQILDAARSNFDDVFQEAFTKAGYTVVTKPGADVLRVATGVIDLYLNAPDTMSATRTRTYTANAGEATLVIEMRDSLTGALLGRVLDRRETLDTGMQWANRVSNTADFRNLFRTWSSITVKGLADLKEISPLPATLTPGQKLDR
jgi:hypothetical protein